MNEGSRASSRVSERQRLDLSNAPVKCRPKKRFNLVLIARLVRAWVRKINEIEAYVEG